MTRRPFFEMSVRSFLQAKRAQVEAESRIIADEVSGYCTTCGYSHRPEDRRRALRRMLPTTLEEVRSEWPCWYAVEGRELASTQRRGGRRRYSDVGEKRFSRDMRAIGAVFVRVGVWAGMWVLAETVRARGEHGACP